MKSLLNVLMTFVSNILKLLLYYKLLSIFVEK